jgi:hypothetical protein
MAGFYLTVEQEAQIDAEIQRINRRKAQQRAVLSPQLSTVVGELSREFPSADPGILLSTAQAYTSGRMSNDQLKTFLKEFEQKEFEKLIADQKAEKEQNKSWWQRNVADKVRTGSRWALAGVEFPLNVFQNVASQAANLPEQIVDYGQNISSVTSGPQVGGAALNVPRVAAAATPPMLDGFMISTDLGTMLRDSERSGSGYFLGGEAKQLQAERARDYRGTVDGKAWTLGRGLADVVFTPGTTEYNILSGLVDAVPAIAIPVAPPGAKAGVKVLANKAGLRSLSGLTNYNTAMIVPERAAEFLGSRSGQKVIRKLTKVDTVDEALEIFPTANVQFLKNVSKISDEVEMKDFLSDTLGLGDVKRGLGPRSIDDVNLSSWDAVKRGIIQGESKVARMMSSMPGRHVVLAGPGSSDREKIQSLKNVKNYLRGLGKRSGMTEEKRKKLVEDLADAFVNDDGSSFLVQNAIKNTISESFDALGLHPQLKSKLLKGFEDYRTAVQNRMYGDLDNAVNSADHKGIYETVVDGQIVLTSQPLNTATIQPEMLKHILMLPDPRQTRRLVSRIGWITGKKGIFDPTKRGELNIPFTVLEHMQNTIWKPLTLMTAGYVQRNMADSLLRQTFNPNMKSGIYHPLELIQVAMYKKYKGDILGGSFKGDVKELIENDQQEMAEAVLGTIRENGDPIRNHVRGRLSGVWKDVKIADGPSKFSEGIAAELHLLSNDKIARRIAAGDAIEDLVDDDGVVVVKGILSSLEDEPDLKTLRTLQNMWRGKPVREVSTGEEVMGSVEFIRPDGTVNRYNVEQYVRNLIVPRIEATTGGSPIFREIIATGGYSNEAGDFVQVFGRQNDMFRQYDAETLFPIIKQEMNNPNITLKEVYKMQESIDDPSMSGIKDAWDFVTNKFFAELYPKREAFLNRSPAFRQFYYGVIDELVDELTPKEATRLLAGLEDRLQVAKGSDAARKAVAKYTGSQKLTDRLYEISSNKVVTRGKLTLEELDAYAKGYALDETKKLFYNVSERSEFADIMRIIAPFGQAWAEVSKKWVKTLTTDPEALKRLGMSVQALQEADPDNDGRGFFFKDPTTGEMMFNYPFSEQLGPMITGFSWGVTGAIVGGLPGAAIAGGAGLAAGFGTQQLMGDVDPVLSAPAKSLNMGLSLFPGLGPFIQVPAALILRQFPDLDWVTKLATPYGTPNVGVVTAPSWAEKMWQAIRADANSDRIFADMKIDAARALKASNPEKYDLSTPQGIDLLDEDSTQTARILLMYRAFGQFAGPSRPGVEFKFDSKEGDVYANELSKHFFELQAMNYDTAVETFLDTYGEDFILYTSGKTKALEGGLDASQEFGRWERKNEGLFKSYPTVAGYFAPVGSTFDYQVYVRQLESGKREKLSLRELIAESQFRVGSAIYRSVSRSAGQSPNKEQEAILRDLRSKLYDTYPGFRDAALDINSRNTRIAQLSDAVNDRRLNDNPIAEAARAYLSARDQALSVAQGRGFVSLSAKANADLRGILFRLGEDLSSQFPEFERLWERVLFSEVGLDQEILR